MPAKSEPIRVASKSAGQVAADSGEAELLHRLRARDSAAFEALVMEQGGRMLSVAKRFLSHEQDAADAVQDAFPSAFKGIGSLRASKVRHLSSSHLGQRLPDATAIARSAADRGDRGASCRNSTTPGIMRMRAAIFPVAK